MSDNAYNANKAIKNFVFAVPRCTPAAQVNSLLKMKRLTVYELYDTVTCGGAKIISNSN